MIANLKVVITSLNLKEDTLACIRSLIQAGAQPEMLIVVDNGSTDGTVEAICQEFGPQITLLAHPENVGYSLACNQGFQIAVDQGAEWVLLINNDTEVAPDFFQEMEKALQINPGFSIFHPAILYYSDPNLLWHMGARRIGRTLIYKNRFTNVPYDPSWPPLIEVDVISSCAILIHKPVVDKIGLFDPKFIIYWDETEFCQRAHVAGYRIAAMTKVKMWHKVAKTMGRQKPRARYLYIRNQIVFYRRNSQGLLRLLMLAFALYKSLVTVTGDLVRQQTDLIPALLKGWADGLRGL